MQGEHRDGSRQRQLWLGRRRLGIALLDGQHGVLQARVVELHDVRAGRAEAVQAARQVDVDDVRAARAEAELDRLDVDDDLVADVGRTDQRDVGDRGAPLAAGVDRQALLERVRRTRGEHGGAPQAEHASSSANVTSSMPSSAATATRSSGSWLRSVPLARFVTCRPAAMNALASEPPPVARRCGA